MSNPFLRYLAKIAPKKPVQSIQVELLAEDFTGTIHATDIQLQGGSLLTGWVPNTEEMLARPRDQNGNIVPPKHFNALIRGSIMVIVPNTGGMVMTATAGGGGVNIYTPSQQPVTTGLDVEATLIKDTTGPVSLQTYYQTRTLTYSGKLNAGDVLNIDSAAHNVTVNGSQVQPGPSTYQGAPLTCPYGDTIYRVNMTGRDAARFLFGVTEWVAGGVTW